MQRKSPSLVGRAVAAILLTVAFYGLAICIAAALLAIPVLEVVYAHRLHAKLAIVCVVAGFAIIAAIWPRFDRFQPPGIRLNRADHPGLFGLIGQVAAQAGQSVPADVYLVPEVNAFVSERGGVLGVGSRRVMGVGLPLLQALNVSQFLGVMAHEFGHFHGGDTKLGRWVYKTHAAIVRTLVNLQQSVIQKPFVLYAKLFLRITNAISRQQEYAADAFAVEIAGRKAYSEGLRKVHGLAPAYDAFWRNEMVPVLASRYRAQIAAGFGQFVSRPEIEQKIEESITRQEREEKTDVYDTHPALPDRLAAVRELPEKAGPEDTRRAISLLQGVNDLEIALLRFNFGPERTAGLKPVEWQAVGREVYLPHWRKTAQEYADVLRDVSVDRLPALAKSPDALIRVILAKAEKPLPREEQLAGVAGILGSALAQALATQGWEINAPPGADVELARNGLSVAPFREVAQWGKDENAAEAWSSRCRELGLAGIPVVS